MTRLPSPRHAGPPRQPRHRAAPVKFLSRLAGTALPAWTAQVLAATRIRICPLAATKKTPRPSQNVSRFTSSRGATPPRAPNTLTSPRAAIIALSLTDQPVRAALALCATGGLVRHPAAVSPARSWDAAVPVDDRPKGVPVAAARSRAGQRLSSSSPRQQSWHERLASNDFRWVAPTDGVTVANSRP